MARPLRIVYAGAWYHVMNRGRHREKIFLDKTDYQTYMNLLSHAFDLYELEVHSFSLMPNHYHLLVRTPRANLSRAIRHVDGIYAQTFNRRHACDGSLFRGRYKSILVEADSYLEELVRYIHRNPFEAGLEKRLGEHFWTSHRHYLKPSKKSSWLHTDFVLSLFADRKHDAISLLKEFVNKERSPELVRRLASVKWPAILGGEKFKEWLKEHHLGKRLSERNVPQLRDLLREYKLDRLKLLAEQLWEIPPDEWLKTKRGRRNDKRRAMIYVSRHYLKATAAEAAQAFGVHHAAVSIKNGVRSSIVNTLPPAALFLPHLFYR